MDKTSQDYKTELEALVESLPIDKMQKYDILWKAGMMMSHSKVETLAEINKMYEMTSKVFGKAS